MEFEERKLPPGTGAFRPADEQHERFKPANHMSGWNIAVQRALDNIGRAKGSYSVEVTLNAVVEVTNPGHIVEYLATVK
jgi:hypothetical protein